MGLANSKGFVYLLPKLRAFAVCEGKNCKMAFRTAPDHRARVLRSCPWRTFAEMKMVELRNPSETPADAFRFNLDDPWECTFLARRLGVSENALTGATTIQELCERVAVLSTGPER